MPKVSIIMPLFNKSAFLREAISSILNQSFDDFELIIVDDHSTDNSVAIVSGFDDPRIQCFANSRNMGQADTLNNGIEKASGEYVTFAHGDDIWLDNFLSRHVALMDQHKGINISHARAHVIDETGNITQTASCNDEQPYSITSYDKVLSRLLEGSYLTTPTVLLRRGAFPFFSNRYVFSCDWELWLRIAAAKNDFLFIDEPLIYYRLSPGNVTSTAMKTGVNIIEDYLTLAGFFEKWPEHLGYRKMAMRRLSMRTLRLSREVQSKETIFLYHKLAAVFYPFNLLNPLYYLYLLTGLSFGHKGLGSLKKLSKSVSSGIRQLRSLNVQ
jgi:glycosyltransferase involved in cell wall biosynthesis